MKFFDRSTARISWWTVVSACFVVFGLSLANLAQSAERVGNGLLVLYTFETPAEGVLRDRSAFGQPLNLRIEKSPGTTVRDGRLIVTSPARISSMEPARKIVTAIKQSKEMSIEAWIRPQNTRQSGPARIVSLSADTGQRNFTLGQDARQFDVRLRSTSTDGNGIPSTPSPKESLRAEQTHFIYTRGPEGAARIYLDGKEVATGTVAGSFDNWNDDYRLSLANELTGDRPWFGEFSLVAIYGRALSADEVSRNSSADLPVKPCCLRF